MLDKQLSLCRTDPIRDLPNLPGRQTDSQQVYFSVCDESLISGREMTGGAPVTGPGIVDLCDNVLLTGQLIYDSWFFTTVFFYCVLL